jgi:DtxR family Mn-dependent transcriptional regulator
MYDMNGKSESVQDYLKAIYEAGDATTGASQTQIAALLGVTPSGVSKMLRQLQKQGLIAYEPYHPVHLTEIGRKEALATIRHHRLLETYLNQSLGFSWDLVHNEAHRLEHHISEAFEASIDRLLGYPKYDPHGDPIPTRDGQMPPAASTTLESQQIGAVVIISRVTDEDSELLKYIAAKGLRPGAAVTIESREPYGGSLILRVDGREERIGPEVARQIFIEAG